MVAIRHPCRARGPCGQPLRWASPERQTKFTTALARTPGPTRRSRGSKCCLLRSEFGSRRCVLRRAGPTHARSCLATSPRRQVFAAMSAMRNSTSARIATGSVHCGGRREVGRYEGTPPGRPGTSRAKAPPRYPPTLAHRQPTGQLSCHPRRSTVPRSARFSTAVPPPARPGAACGSRNKAGLQLLGRASGGLRTHPDSRGTALALACDAVAQVAA
jgi:hypothetical protein